MIAITNKRILMRFQTQVTTTSKKISLDQRVATTCKITNKSNPQERLTALITQNRLLIQKTNHLTDQGLMRTLKKMMSMMTGTRKVKTT